MLMIKGDNGKSVVANILLDSTNSKCFVYNDYPVINNSLCVDSTKYSLAEFMQCIKEYHTNIAHPDDQYDYLIIYTNQTEISLKRFIGWLVEYNNFFCCKDIIVMCR